MSSGYNSIELTPSVPMQSQEAKIDNAQIKMRLLHISHTERKGVIWTHIHYIHTDILLVE